MSKFQVGDVVICTNTGGYAEFTHGDTYVIEGVCGDLLLLEGIDGHWIDWRFELANPPINLQKNYRVIGRWLDRASAQGVDDYGFLCVGDDGVELTLAEARATKEELTGLFPNEAEYRIYKVEEVE